MLDVPLVLIIPSRFDAIYNEMLGERHKTYQQKLSDSTNLIPQVQPYNPTMWLALRTTYPWQ